MTRINANIPVKNLTDQHLLAEHREIKRVCNRFKQRLAKGEQHVHQTHDFCLGKGHEIFFIDKGMFTYLRYCELFEECDKRGFDVTSFHDCWTAYRPYKGNKFYKYHYFTESDNDLIRERIATRLAESNQVPRYYGEKITVEQAINLINKK